MRKSLKYTYKIFILLALTLMSVFTVMGYNNYRTVYAFTVEQFYENHGHTHMIAQNYIRSIMGKVETMARKIAIEKAMLFTSDRKSISRYLQECLSISPLEVKSIYFLSGNAVYSSNQLLYDIYGNAPMYDTVTKKTYPYLSWEPPYTSLLSGHVLPLVYEVNAGHEHGILLIELDLEYLNTFIANIYGEDSLSYLVSYHTQGGPTTLIGNNEDILYQAGQNTGTVPLSRDIHSFFYKDDIIKNISIITNADLRSIQKDLQGITNNLISSTFLALVIIVVFAFIIAYILTRPLEELTRKMREIDQYDDKSLFQIKIDKQYRGEFKELADSYNDMLDRIQSLIVQNEETLIQKRKYEIKILQNQIGPHFLHNTLICIGNLFHKNEAEKARSALKSLIALLSYSFQSASDMVALREELEIIDRFVFLLKLRFGANVQFDYDLPTDMENMKVPKLCLQPFVENSIFHGIIPNGSKGSVQIICSDSDGCNIIKIVDNGVGIENPDGLLTQSKKSKGIGIYNTHQRLKLYWGDAYDIAFHSVPYQRTEVILHFSK